MFPYFDRLSLVYITDQNIIPRFLSVVFLHH